LALECPVYTCRTATHQSRAAQVIANLMPAIKTFHLTWRAAFEHNTLHCALGDRAGRWYWKPPDVTDFVSLSGTPWHHAAGDFGG
jgi:hypothetical protein